MFGLAGFVLPAEAVRGFGTWFFQRKCELLDFEIRRSGEHPTVWEKKGASLFTVANVTRYRELRNFTNRLFNTIETLGGFVFYVGIEKTAAPADHDPNQLYKSVLVEAIKRIDDFCEQDCDPPASFIVILDEHDQRSALIAAAARSMYGQEPRRHLIEPPFHLESHRYQTLQAADWIAGLVGRLGAIWAAPADYPDNEPFRRYLGAALLRRRPKGLLPAARQELLDPSKAWWGGRRGRLADRPRYSISVSLGVVPRWYSRVVEVPVRIEVAAGFVAPGASEPPRLQPSWPPGGFGPAHG